MKYISRISRRTPVLNAKRRIPRWKQTIISRSWQDSETRLAYSTLDYVTPKHGTICKTLYHAAEKHNPRYQWIWCSYEQRWGSRSERGEAARRPSVYERSTIRRMLSTRNCQWCSNSLPTTSRLSALTMLQQLRLTVTNNIPPISSVGIEFHYELSDAMRFVNDGIHYLNYFLK